MIPADLKWRKTSLFIIIWAQLASSRPHSFSIVILPHAGSPNVSTSLKVLPVFLSLMWDLIWTAYDWLDRVEWGVDRELLSHTTFSRTRPLKFFLDTFFGLHRLIRLEIIWMPWSTDDQMKSWQVNLGSEHRSRWLWCLLIISTFLNGSSWTTFDLPIN